MAIVGTLPITLQNGTPNDATQVMTDLQFIVDQVNANAGTNTFELNLTSSAPGSGIDLIGGSGRVVSSITELRAQIITGNGRAFALGYYAPGDGGGGQYWYNSADTTTADNGGSIIVAADGGRWYLAQSRSIDIRQFGAKGDGVTDDVTKFEAACAWAASQVTSRFSDGYTVIIPKGRFFFSRAPASITSSQIMIEGQGNQSVIYGGTTCTWNLMVFDGSALALFGCGVRKLRFDTPGNCTAGRHLYAIRCINFWVEDNQFNGWFDGLELDGCARVFLDNNDYTQDNRTNGTTPRYAMHLTATNFSCSDIHLGAFNIFTDPVNSPSAETMLVEGCDGLYWGADSHSFGATVFRPAVTGTFPSGQTIASIRIQGHYFDTTPSKNISFQGTSAIYREIKILGNKCRDSGGTGLEFNASSTISRVIVADNDFDGPVVWGINGISTVTGAQIHDNKFNNCNTSNIAGGGDIAFTGNGLIHDNYHISGGANGNCIVIRATSSNIGVHHNDFRLTNVSSSARFIVDNGGSTKFQQNYGFTTYNVIQATVASGTSSVTVNHNMNVQPGTTDCVVTPGQTATNGAVSWRVSATTSTQITVSTEVAVSANTVFNVTINKEH